MVPCRLPHCLLACLPALAAARQTEHNHLQLYGLNVSSEALWRLPDGGEVRRVNVYLSHRCFF